MNIRCASDERAVTEIGLASSILSEPSTSSRSSPQGIKAVTRRCKSFDSLQKGEDEPHHSPATTRTIGYVTHCHPDFSPGQRLPRGLRCAS